MLEINNVSKIGVISDTHIHPGEKPLSPDILEHFKSVDLIVHCGDIIIENVLTCLKTSAPVVAVNGNNDSHFLTCPESEILRINSRFTVCVAHGTGPYFDIKQRLYKKFIEYKPDLILHGHTHVAGISEYQGISFFNPGSASAVSKFQSIGMMFITENGIRTEVIAL
jgi:uncharacterized protein